jgi:hypothetical protein
VQVKLLASVWNAYNYGQRKQQKTAPRLDQVNLLFTKFRSALCNEQQHSPKQDFFRGYGVAEVPPGFQAGWSDCTYFFYLSVFHFVYLSGISLYT